MIITDLPFEKKAQNVTLTKDLYLEQWIIPKGTTIKTKETINFGIVILPEKCKDKKEFIIPKRIFKY